MRRALIILIVLLGVFLATGCTGNETQGNETGTPVEAVTEVEVVTGQEAVTPVQEVVAVTEVIEKTPVEAVTPAEYYNNTTANRTTTETQNVTETTGMKEFTLEELAKYNGSNGKTYVAYKGKVYDVSDSNLWKNGTHKNTHYAGKDLTEELDNDAPHGPEVFKDYTVVGTLKK